MQITLSTKAVNRRRAYLFMLSTVFLLLGLPSASLASNSTEKLPSLDNSARLFLERCTLCHGNEGMGGGLLPITLPQYPATNLLTNLRAKSAQEIHKIIEEGCCIEEKVGMLMPPWKGELSDAQITGLVELIQALRSKTQQTRNLLKEQANKMKHQSAAGKELYRSRCSLCHGNEGRGDGRMARVVKNPPPANLVQSRLPDEYLKNIILNGGEGRGPIQPNAPLERSAIGRRTQRHHHLYQIPTRYLPRQRQLGAIM